MSLLLVTYSTFSRHILPQSYRYIPLAGPQVSALGPESLRICPSIAVYGESLYPITPRNERGTLFVTLTEA